MSREDKLIDQINAERKQQLNNAIRTIATEIVPYIIKATIVIVGIVVLGCLVS